MKCRVCEQQRGSFLDGQSDALVCEREREKKKPVWFRVRLQTDQGKVNSELTLKQKAVEPVAAERAG